MRVGIQCCADGRVAKPFLDYFRMYTLLEHDGSMGMACIVKADTIKPALADQFDPGMSYAVRQQWPSVPVAEYQVIFCYRREVGQADGF